MDYEETIVPKKYVRPATPLPEGYIAPEISGALVIHGSSLNTYFHLPPHIEVVIFSRRGQILHTYVIKELLKWIDKDFHTISRSSLQEYHLKRFVEKKCSGESILERENYYKVIQQQHPNVCKSRRFKPYKSLFTATLQIFRGGQDCPDILLSNDKDGKMGGGGSIGFWNFNPLFKDETNTDKLIRDYPFPLKIPLSELLQVLFKDPNKRVRLYLFCCRVEYVGKEASKSSNVSQNSSANLDELAKTP